LPPALIAIDQGTTSTRAIVFNAALAPLASAQQELPQIFPGPGEVEHDPEEIWSATVATVRAALAKAGLSAGDIAGIGITNQRETTVIWDRATGRPIHNAIVWQDRRTAGYCDRLRAEGHEAVLAAKTGLLLDPYFSASKIAWLLEHVAGAREKAEAGALAFGTIDSFLLWRLTGGKVHATDATNAARTALFDTDKGEWDEDLCRLFGVPPALLPEVRDCAGDFGVSTPDLFGAPIRILGMAGDQQAATVGQGCFTPGMMKSTYGTGCFMVLNTGPTRVVSRNRLLTTIAYQLDGRRTYALEGAIFIAGAAVQWLRDGLKIIAKSSEVGALASHADPAAAVYLVPAFVGLGAPYWDPQARGAIFGLTRDSGAAEIARAALEAVGYQTRDLLDAMRGDWPAAAGAKSVLRVDGGMTASDPCMQFLADILACPVDRPVVMETTALGAAYLARPGWAVAPPAAALPVALGFLGRLVRPPLGLPLPFFRRCTVWARTHMPGERKWAVLLATGMLFTGLAIGASAYPVIAQGIETLRVVVGGRAWPDQVELRVLDVGQGNAVLLRTPQHHAVLFDGGPGGCGLARKLRALGVDDLDLVVVSHPHADHFAGLLEVVDSVKVRLLIDDVVVSAEQDRTTAERTDAGQVPAGNDGGKGSSEAAAYLELRRELERAGSRYAQAVTGDSLTIDDVLVTFFAPRSHLVLVDGPAPWSARGDEPSGDEPNASSLVAVVSAGSIDVLLPGDAEAEVLRSYSLPPTEVLVVPHHGSRGAVSADLLARWGTRVALISVGRDNRFGHPDAGTLATLEQSVGRVVRTDTVGWVCCTMHGLDLTLSAEHMPTDDVTTQAP
jgi:glycerol kinase